jgi:hypothetical protein
MADSLGLVQFDAIAFGARRFFVMLTTAKP